MLLKTARSAFWFYSALGLFLLALLVGSAGSTTSARTSEDAQAQGAAPSRLDRTAYKGISQTSKAAQALAGQSGAAGPLGGTATPTPCPPNVINGSITFDDPIRTQALEYDNIAASCAAPKSCPPVVDLRLNYDPYIYVNSTGATQCVTVGLDGLKCGAGLQVGVFSSAYLGSFDPNNACANYLADAGTHTGPLRGPTSFSFSVPAGATYIVVVEEFYEPFGCDSYTLTVSGTACGTPQPSPTRTPTLCPPTVVNGSIDEGDPLAIGSLDFTGTSGCNSPKPCPDTIEGEYRFDTYTYTNTGGASACIVVTVDGTSCGTSFEGVFSAAYTGSFHPNNPCANYLADPGTYSDPVTGPLGYGFTVPAGGTFVIMVQEVVPIVGCENYTLTVSGLATCNTPTAVPPTATPTGTNTPVPPTSTPPNASPTATPTPCTITFSDVQPADYFYEPVRYLFCRGVISGYADNTFRPYTNTTRGQLTKIVVLAEGWPIDTTGGPHFNDVPENNAFYTFIETTFNRGIISGYADGTFRWGNNVTRGQLAKIVVLAEGWPIDTTGGPHFADVPPTHTFYDVIETAYNRGIISGYSDLTFRPGNPATRGQIAKIVHSAVTQP